MSLTLVHTADWQIGKSFGAFPPEVAIPLREARLDAIDRIAAVAKEAGARHVLVAGDVFEAELASLVLLRQPMERMRAHRELTWHLLPGNHDPDRPGGLWERLGGSGLPANVRLHLRPEPAEIEADVFVLPAPLHSRATSEDPTAWMDEARTPSGALRIGLAHGSIQGFGEEGEAAIPIAPTRASTARLDYLALGDWHGALKIADRVWYSGTPEPDRYKANDPGNVLVVRLAGPGKGPEVTKVAVGHFRWVATAIEVESARDLDALEVGLQGSATPLSRILLSLALTGQVSLSAYAEIEARLQRLLPSLRQLERDDRGLRLRPQTTDLDQVGAAGDLRSAAEILAGLTGSDDPVLARNAERALARLLGLAAGKAGHGTP